jgi:hypothetical protein
LPSSLVAAFPGFNPFNYLSVEDLVGQFSKSWSKSTSKLSSESLWANIFKLWAFSIISEGIWSICLICDMLQLARKWGVLEAWDCWQCGPLVGR